MYVILILDKSYAGEVMHRDRTPGFVINLQSLSASLSSCKLMNENKHQIFFPENVRGKVLNEGTEKNKSFLKCRSMQSGKSLLTSGGFCSRYLQD